jgi:hypothetical protein
VRENKRIRQTQAIRWGGGLLLFVIVNFVLRAALLPVNQAEYTDGILQLTQFSQPTGLWPPLYTALCWPLSLLVGPMWSGRIVSVIFSTAAVIPIYLLALRSFGARAAIFAALVYTVAPTSLRWAPRVMTDATFTFFFWCACERLIAAQGSRDEGYVNKALAWACAWGTLASLTRYQGLLLAPPVLVLAIVHWRLNRFFPLRGVLCLLFYALVGVWLIHAGTIHGGQYEQRTAQVGLWMTFLVSAEPFVLYMPYFLTYPVALLVMLGLNQARARPRHMMIPLTTYIFIVLVIAQSLFASFQERYFLPFFGFLYIWAGVGLAIVDHRYRRRFPRLRPYIPIITVAWSLFISALVIIGSRQAFGDIRAASRYVASLTATNPAERVYGNEQYPLPGPPNRASHAPKMNFFSRRPVYLLSDEYFAGTVRLEPGDLVMLSSRHGAEFHLEALLRLYDLEELKVFDSTVTPVFPDIMSIPGTDQSAMAWLYRYVPQHFYTAVYRVKGPR